MPSKQRVLDGRLRFTADALPRIIHWKTGDFPEYLAAQCDRHSIQFVDLMPALVEQTNKGMPTCNPIWDTHLNETGSKVVARMLTDAMCGAADRDKTQ